MHVFSFLSIIFCGCASYVYKRYLYIAFTLGLWCWKCGWLSNKISSIISCCVLFLKWSFRLKLKSCTSYILHCSYSMQSEPRSSLSGDHGWNVYFSWGVRMGSSFCLQHLSWQEENMKAALHSCAVVQNIDTGFTEGKGKLKPTTPD